MSDEYVYTTPLSIHIRCAVGKECLVGKLLLVLLLDPVAGFVVPHHTLKKHYLQGLLSFVCGNLQLLIRDVILVLRACIPSSVSCLTLGKSLPQKCSLAFIVMDMAWRSPRRVF